MINIININNINNKGNSSTIHGPITEKEGRGGKRSRESYAPEEAKLIESGALTTKQNDVEC